MAKPRSPEYDDLLADLTPAERVRARKRLWYQHRKAERAKKREALNRKKGHKAPSGPHRGVTVQTQVSVPESRRYVIIGGHVFFSTQTAFTVPDLRAIIKEIAADLAARANISEATATASQKKSA